MRSIRRLLSKRRKAPAPTVAPELTPYDIETMEQAKPYTMTSPQRLQALILATRYIHRRQLPGAIVECGVWRGGSMFAAARTLLSLGDTTRELYLYDTFSGMPPPSDIDRRSHDGKPALTLLADPREEQTRAVAGLDIVQRTMAQAAYPSERVHFVSGKVEDTIPGVAPDQIAILRLDTDWYSSTMHELVHLYSRLVRGGVLIIDDYGWWEGARRAVEEFFSGHSEPPLLNVIDETGRIAVRA
jgi:O-methyltransferase